MIRHCLLAATLLIAPCMLAQNSSPDADSTAAEASTTQTATGHGMDVSGFEILNRIKNPEELRFYPDRLLARVRHKWYPQIRELRNSVARKPGMTVIEFAVQRDGSIADLKTIDSAGDASLDEAALQAISSAAPFAELPEAYSGTTLNVRMHFGYEQPVSSKAPVCHGPDWGAHAAGYVVHHVGDGVTAPKAIHSSDPEYSEQARRDKYMSTVRIAGTVDPQGDFTDLCVATAAGEGLDEKAMEAVSAWKFEPATLQEQPVAVRINVEVTFRLY